MTINALIIEAEETLKLAGVAEPLLEARSLMVHAINRDRTFLFAHPEYELDQIELNKFREFVARRNLREPFQYIVGKQEFYGLDFQITPDVLIPRPETELLVEAAIESLVYYEAPTFLEIGAGSGCISIAILRAVPTALGTAIDISTRALEIAHLNAKAHSVDNRLRLLHSNLFDAVSCSHFDMIVSNPPYISLTDFQELQPEVRNFEPVTALTDGGDGLSIIELIIAGSAERLVHRGKLMLEIGCGQSESVKRMFSPKHWSSTLFLQDLQQIPRTVIGTRL